jgi:hypothetical protein
MVADMSQHIRERHLFPDYRGCFGIFLFKDEMNIAGYIYPRRTYVSTRNKR